MPHHTIYLVRHNTHRDLWWSSDGTWLQLSAALVYTPGEQAASTPPQDGHFVAFVEVGNLTTAEPRTS